MGSISPMSEGAPGWEEGLRAVPKEWREESLGGGATKEETRAADCPWYGAVSDMRGNV
jgi:hypothetical protein